MGTGLFFQGDGKIFLESGATLRFDSSATGTAAVFAPSMMDTTDSKAMGFAYNCNLNWRVNSNKIPATPPCNSDQVQINPASGNVYFLSTFSQSAGAQLIQSGSARKTSCDANTPDALIFNDSPVIVDVAACSFYFKFGQQSNPTQFISCPAPQCPGTILNTDASGNQVQMIIDGPNAGTVYVEGADGYMGNDTMVGVTQPDGTTTYTYSNITVGADGVARPKASTEEESSSGTTIIIIIIVVAIIAIVAIIGVVVVITNKQSSSAGASRDSGIVSFENPMYDDVDGNAAGASENYDEPEMTSGYMDLPAGGEDEEAGGFGGGGYMDVAPEGGSGYMDVAPEADYDDDDDDGDI